MFWLNCFPHKDGIHATLSPRTIVTASNINYNKHCKLQFGTYAQVCEQHDNSMATRTSGAIALHPTGNAQGSYYFLSLRSGKHIVCNNWTILPMLAEVIATVHQLAKACKKSKAIVFTDRHGNIITDMLTSDENDKNGITGVHENNENGITGVHENDTTTHMGDITGVNDEINNEEINNEISNEINDNITGVNDDENDDTTHANKNENNKNNTDKTEGGYDVAHKTGKKTTTTQLMMMTYPSKWRITIYMQRNCPKQLPNSSIISWRNICTYHDVLDKISKQQSFSYVHEYNSQMRMTKKNSPGQYLRCMRELTLTIEPSTNAQQWIDSSYTVHPDMHSHSGIIMMLGKGVTYSTSCKQKLNTKSSTEAELVAIDNAMGQVL